MLKLLQLVILVSIIYISPCYAALIKGSAKWKVLDFDFFDGSIFQDQLEKKFANKFNFADINANQEASLIDNQEVNYNFDTSFTADGKSFTNQNSNLTVFNALDPDFIRTGNGILKGIKSKNGDKAKLKGKYTFLNGQGQKALIIKFQAKIKDIEPSL